jgi:hypothetical protein
MPKYESSYRARLSRGVYTTTTMPMIRLLNEVGPCDELGVTREALLAIRVAPPDKGQMLLDELKRIAKSRYRKLAFALHPDRNPGDSASAAKFSYFSEAMRLVEKMAYDASPPPVEPVLIVRGIVFHFAPRPPGVPLGGRVAVSRTTTASPPAGIPRGARVAFLRPT